VVLESREKEQAFDGIVKNPVIAFPVKKRINTELFIERMATLYILTSWIRNNINKRG